MTKKRLVRLVVLALALLLLGRLIACRSGGNRAAPPVASAPPAPSTPRAPAPPARVATRPAPAAIDDTSGVIDGRVVDGMSHRGVPDAELSFLGDAGAATFRTSSDGTFELTPTTAGRFTLSAITAAGYLPYAPELGSTAVQITLARGQSVHGVVLVLYPAVDCRGRVVDARGAPVAAARVRLVGGRGGAPVVDVDAAWQADRDGFFTFQAAEDSVLEASSGSARGWALVDHFAAVNQRLTIRLGQPPNDATITGHVRDTAGAPIADAMVRATPSMFYGSAAPAFATTGADGSFTLSGVDRAAYDVSAEAEDHVRGVRINILGGSRSVELTLDPGLLLAGQVVDPAGAAVATFKLLVMRHAGAARPVVVNRSLIDPQGRFAVRVARGDYDVLAVAHGCARGTPTQAAAGATDLRIVLGSGATLHGRVIAGDDHAPIAGASIGCELSRGSRDTVPVDAGTVSRADGTFELGDLAAGPLAIRIRANGFHDLIEAGITASDGRGLGPVTIELHRIDPDDLGRTEMVGIGVEFYADGDALRVGRVTPGSGAFDAGLGFGDRITAVDGSSVAALGLDATLARLRGIAGTTVTLTVQRGGRDLRLVIERRLFRA